jgi:hypothetical protein
MENAPKIVPLDRLLAEPDTDGPPDLSKLSPYERGKYDMEQLGITLEDMQEAEVRRLGEPTARRIFVLYAENVDGKSPEEIAKTETPADYYDTGFAQELLDRALKEFINKNRPPKPDLTKMVSRRLIYRAMVKSAPLEIPGLTEE